MPVMAGVRDLKNSLSRYLRLVRGGESVLVLDRGKPVAVLTAVSKGVPARTTAEHLAGLAKRGLVNLGGGRRHHGPCRPPKVDLSRAVARDREERA